MQINYITLHYITLHYITLHYFTLHYITLLGNKKSAEILQFVPILKILETFTYSKSVE